MLSPELGRAGFPDAWVRHRESLWIGATTLLAILLAYPLAYRPWLIAGLVGGVAVITLTLLRPLTIVGLMLFLGPFDLSVLTGGFKSLFTGLGGLDMNGIRLVGVVISFTAIMLVDRDVVRHALGRHGRWYAIFLLYAALTLYYTPAPVDGLRLLLKLAYPFLTFVLVLGVARTPADIERLARWALAGAVAIVLLNPLAVIAGAYTIENGHVRIYGLGMGHNVASFYLLIMLLMSFARFTVRGELRYLLLCALLALWMALTLTRVTLGATIVALAGLALYDAIVARRLRTLGVAALVGAALALPLMPIMLQRTFGFVPSYGEVWDLVRDPGALYRAINWQGRQVVWPVIASAFLSQPIIGLGLGASTAVLFATFSTSMGGVIHNEYLRLATDTGIIGVALFAAALLTWMVALVRAGRGASPSVREYALPAFAGIIAWSIISITDNAFDYYAPFTQFVGFLSAGALALREFAGTPAAPGSTSGPNHE